MEENYLVLCDINNLSEEDKLERSSQVYKVVKENFFCVLDIIDMLSGESHNIYENFTIFGGYGEKRIIDYDLFSKII